MNLPSLVEDLDAVVAAIRRRSSRPFESNASAVRLVELDGAGALLPELAQVLAALVEHDDARVLAAVAFGDVDVAVRGGHDVVRLEEAVRRRFRRPATPSVISSLPSGLNLKTWCPISFAGGGGSGASGGGAAGARAACCPARRSPRCCRARSTWIPCGKIISPAPKLATSFPAGSNFRTDRQIRIQAGVRAAAFADPDRTAVLVDIDGARRSPRPAVGHLRPAFDRAVRIGLGGRVRRQPRDRR